MRWIWWLLGLGAVGVGGYYLISSATGKKIPAKTACTIDLAEPYKTKATKAMAANDVVTMTSLAAQFDAQGWTCAATELRAAALKAKASTAGIADVPDPPRSAWQKLVDRSLGEADPGGDLVASLEAAAADAARTGYQKVRDLLRDAARDVRRTMRLARITEEPPTKAVQAMLANTTDPKYIVTKATVDSLKSLAAQLDALGYSGAATEARSMADAAQKKIDTATVSAAFTPTTAEFGPLISSIVTDPFASLPVDLRAEVDAAYASGDPQQLVDLQPKLVAYLAAWTKVTKDAAAIRARWKTPFLDLPTGKGSVFAEIDTSGEAIIPGSDRATWGKPPATWETDVKPITDALWKRGYKTAANQLGQQWSRFKWGSTTTSTFINGLYPLPA